MGISRRAYAELRGVAESAVRKAIASQRISVSPDGTIDPATADLEWDRNTDPSRLRGSPSSVAPASEPEPEAVAPAVSAPAGPAPAAGAGDPKGMSYAKIREALDLTRLQALRFKLDIEKGKYVERDKASQLFFDLARGERDAWVQWPPRIAANMAADLGVDPHKMEQVLDKYLRAQLAELAELRIDIR